MWKQYWKRITPLLLALLCAIVCMGCGMLPSAQNNSSFVTGAALPYHEQKPNHLHLPKHEPPVVATWLPYFLYPDLFGGKTEAEAHQTVRNLLESAKDIGINTIFAHACAFGEAYYDSTCYPKASETRQLDYLQILAEECNGLGISLHAWINPLRLQTPDEMAAWRSGTVVADWYHDSAKRAANMIQVGERYYLQPANDSTYYLLCAAAEELLTHYPIDGIHIDDYFYPTTATAFDADAFADSGAAELAQWRSGNINRILQKMYQTVHSVRSDAVFSVSPCGNLQSNLQTQYADCALWCEKSGYCDWLIPQLYYGYRNQTMPFSETLAKWLTLPRDSSVQVIIGLAAYKVGAIDAFAGDGSAEWQEESALLAKQTADVLTSAESSGAALYHIGNVQQLSPNEKSALQSEILAFFSDSFCPSALS